MHMNDTILTILEKDNHIGGNRAKCANEAGLAN
jgi:hypothetical protein